MQTQRISASYLRQEINSTSNLHSVPAISGIDDVSAAVISSETPLDDQIQTLRKLLFERALNFGVHRSVENEQSFVDAIKMIDTFS